MSLFCLNSQSNAQQKKDNAEAKILVAYFSCTGNTESVAKSISNATHSTRRRIQRSNGQTPACATEEASKQKNGPKTISKDDIFMIVTIKLWLYRNVRCSHNFICFIFLI